MTYDAVLLVSFGGPEAPYEVLPFMEQVTAGRGIPRERLEEVSQHYRLFDGRSPINDQNRTLRAALEAELAAQGDALPVYWGNRNSAPWLESELRRMQADGVERALCLVTSAYASYSGCRQYREDLARAADAVGPGAPQLDKVRAYYNHPGFLEPQADLIHAALDELPEEARAGARMVFTTHSIPRTMSRHSDYEVEHHEACRLVMAAFPGRAWELVYNSRSGPPEVPWLTPDVNDHLTDLAAAGCPGVVVVPIGFVSDHLEVVYDLDIEARATAAGLGLPFARAGTVGTDPRFVAGLAELVRERHAGAPQRALGTRGPNWDACPVDCCRVPGQEERPTVASAPPPTRRGAPTAPADGREPSS
ncbi:ferrochelatase [Nitriliruptor alkaliphilus]|uniref:ferrochelatase n=1 Tax=Nitriliruptor alkaliphilus TaxID=427918 RepID=UPI0009FAAAA0|nr:ferrochelatase [Nitriliruptor alkaliphilus]